MSHGIIESFSEVTQWKIPNFFSLDKVKDQCIVSPRFSSVGCTWHLKLYPKGNVDGYMSVYLNKDDTKVAVAVTYSIGIKTQDGIQNEETRPNRVFEEGSSSWGWTKFLNLDHLQMRKSQLAPSDALVFTCRLEREVPTLEAVAVSHELVDSRQTRFVELESLSSDFKDLLSSEKACDFTLEVQDKKFRAHRAVLSARSPVFCAMLEYDTAEAKNGVMKIPDCRPEVFEDFIRFLYTGKIEDVSFEAAYQLYSTADKYELQQLKSFCADYLRQNLNVDTVCQVIILSDKFSDHQLQSSAQDFFSENFMQIFLTSEWAAMMKDNHRLANKLLTEMASAGLKTP